MKRDEVVAAPEAVDLVRLYFAGWCRCGGVQDEEVIAFVLVGLGTLFAAKGILQSQLVEGELLAQQSQVFIGRGLDVEPQQGRTVAQEAVDLLRVDFANCLAHVGDGAARRHSGYKPSTMRASTRYRTSPVASTRVMINGVEATAGSMPRR